MLIQLLILGVVIGSNNLSVALALGALGQASRRTRVMAVFGVFEFLIPLAGIWLGRTIAALIERQVGWVAPALLAAMGIWCIYEALYARPDAKLARRLTSWGGLVLLATALSFDNLIIGFGLGLGGVEPWLVAGTISLFSMAFTWLGMTLGGAARRHWERPAGVMAGVLLLGLSGVMAGGWL